MNNRITGFRAGFILLSLFAQSACAGGKEGEPISIPTPDYLTSATLACVGFVNDASENGLLTQNATPKDKGIMVRTCEEELSHYTKYFGWPDEKNAFRVSQHVVGEIDANGVPINDWRGGDFAEVLAENILQNAVPSASNELNSSKDFIEEGSKESQKNMLQNAVSSPLSLNNSFIEEDIRERIIGSEELEMDES